MPYGVFTAKDKPLVLAVGNDRQFAHFCDSLKVDWNKNKKYATNPLRVKNRKALKALINRHFKKQSAQHWIKQITMAGVPVGPINSFKDLVRDPQLKARGFFGRDKKTGLPIVKSPLRFSRTPIKKYKILL